MTTSTVEDYPPLLSLAVHEFRTPASVVGGYLRMLVRDPELTDRQRKMIEEAEKSCARLVAIVAELSDIGKLDSGAIAIARQPLDLFALTAEVAELVQEGKDREVHLVVRGPESGAPIVGDVTRLRHALDAIFRAILREKAGPATVVAERRVVRNGGSSAAVIVVAEENSVVAAYEAPAGVFDEKRGGLGLALPLARRVIKGHGGDLWSAAEPDALARGSIILRVPMTETNR
ncbi:MAG TPA: HAMP domain-containing sensor histidine kinase [Vicinamibacterales bacterium]|nr:HAMP domain-containing sensor histidine kinase [Vicinamibacterales bacterium]